MGQLGAHVSIAGGLEKSVARARDLGCEAMQIFLQSARSWAFLSRADSEIEAFFQARKDNPQLQSVVVHNSYLVNLSSSNTTQRQQCVEYCLRLYELCERLKVDALITHPGSGGEAGEQAGLEATAESLNTIFKETRRYRVKFCLENTAGQGGVLGWKFDQMGWIQNNLSNPKRLFYCFDTQHAFAAGYDLRTPKSYQKVFSDWDKAIGLDRIVAFHLNDALKELGTRVDRHQSLGKGHLGLGPFRKLVRDARFQHIPMCLETPPGDASCQHREELTLLKTFR